MNESPVQNLFCANHPDRSTLLRCNRCEKPICNQCAILTPTGYRCRECVRGQQKKFDTATKLDFPLAAVVAFLLGFGGSFIPRVILFFTLFVAPVVGFMISESVRFIVRKRRSTTLFIVAAGSAAVGSLPMLILSILNIFNIYPFGLYIGGWYVLIMQGLYSFLLTATVYYRLSGIQV